KIFNVKRNLQPSSSSPVKGKEQNKQLMNQPAAIDNLQEEKIPELFTEFLRRIEKRRKQLGISPNRLFKSLKYGAKLTRRNYQHRYYNWRKKNTNPVDPFLLKALLNYFEIYPVKKEEKELLEIALRKGQQWVRRLFRQKDGLVPVPICNEIFRRLKKTSRGKLIEIAKDTRIPSYILYMWRKQKYKRIVHPNYAKAILKYYSGLWNSLSEEAQNRINEKADAVDITYYKPQEESLRQMALNYGCSHETIRVKIKKALKRAEKRLYLLELGLIRIRRTSSGEEELVITKKPLIREISIAEAWALSYFYDSLVFEAILFMIQYRQLKPQAPLTGKRFLSIKGVWKKRLEIAKKYINFEDQKGSSSPISGISDVFSSSPAVSPAQRQAVKQANNEVMLIRKMKIEQAEQILKSQGKRLTIVSLSEKSGLGVWIVSEYLKTDQRLKNAIDEEKDTLKKIISAIRMNGGKVRGRVRGRIRPSFRQIARDAGVSHLTVLRYKKHPAVIAEMSKVPSLFEMALSFIKTTFTLEGLTVDSLAEKLGVTRQALWRDNKETYSRIRQELELRKKMIREHRFITKAEPYETLACLTRVIAFHGRVPRLNELVADARAKDARGSKEKTKRSLSRVIKFLKEINYGMDGVVMDFVRQQAFANVYARYRLGFEDRDIRKVNDRLNVLAISLIKVFYFQDELRRRLVKELFLLAKIYPNLKG
ncbi:MAG: hypothetical protein KKA80_01440, partial [Candidatus Omnitrophica bacterium]|nr:hypothetical protein [Candidatus Omnitrophota bacterium]